MQGAMSELFISRVFEEHVAPRRGATWPPPKQQQQQRQQSGPGSDGSASPTSPSRKPSSLPAIPGTSPPRSPASRPLAGTNSSNAASRQQQQEGQEARGSSGGGCGGSWPPPLPPGAACARDEMDLLAFATFVLAWDHRNQPAAIPYFFKIFDIHHRVGLCVGRPARPVLLLSGAGNRVLLASGYVSGLGGCATSYLLPPQTVVPL